MARLSKAQLAAAKQAARNSSELSNRSPVRRRGSRRGTELERRRRETTWNFHENQLVQLRKYYKGMEKGTFGIVVKRHEVDGGRYVEVIAGGDFMMWEASHMEPVETGE